MNDKQAFHTIGVLQTAIAELNIKAKGLSNKALDGDLSVMNQITNIQAETAILTEIISTLSAQAQAFVKEITQA